MHRGKTIGQINRGRDKKFAEWEKNLLNIFRGFYFRHEFARRNEDVLRASRKVLDQLEVPEKLAEQLLSDRGNRYFSDLLINRIEKANGPLRRRRRTVLVDFLAEYGVFPMVQSKNDFFPFEGATAAGSRDLPSRMSAEERLVKLSALWFALVRFEAHVMFKWEVGRTFMLPVMILRDAVFHGRSYSLGKFGQGASATAFPVLIDLSLPENQLLQYLEIVRMHRDMFPKPAHSGLPQERQQWTKLRKSLKAHDTLCEVVGVSTMPLTKRANKGQKHEYYQKLIASKDFKADAAYRNYTRWFGDKTNMVRHYRAII